MTELQAAIKDIPMDKVGMTRVIAKRLNIYPTTEDHNKLLLNHELWFIPFWLGILEMVSAMSILYHLPGTFQSLCLSGYACVRVLHAHIVIML